jgi:flagellin-specific chaperone FliS
MNNDFRASDHVRLDRLARLISPLLASLQQERKGNISNNL